MYLTISVLCYYLPILNNIGIAQYFNINCSTVSLHIIPVGSQLHCHKGPAKDRYYKMVGIPTSHGSPQFTATYLESIRFIQ